MYMCELNLASNFVGVYCALGRKYRSGQWKYDQWKWPVKISRVNETMQNIRLELTCYIPMEVGCRGFAAKLSCKARTIFRLTGIKKRKNSKHIKGSWKNSKIIWDKKGEFVGWKVIPQKKDFFLLLLFHPAYNRKLHPVIWLHLFFWSLGEYEDTL